MAKPTARPTPDNRVDRWKKLWATPRLLDEATTDAAFDEFADALVPGHMHKMFLKQFGMPKAQYGNRFFVDEVSFQNWETRFSILGAGEGGTLEATVIYGSPDRLEAHLLKGETRRKLRDVVIDDWHAACAIIRSSRATFYVFVEPKMRGCIVRTVPNDSAGEPEDDLVSEPEELEAAED